MMDNGQEEQGFKIIKGLADKGIPEAQFILGMLYVYGEGANDQETVKCFLKSAEGGYAPAQLVIGQLYEGGLGVEQNSQEAAKWYKKAADQGIRSWEDAEKAFKKLMK